MKILGISGLENSVSFKMAKWPGLDEREYRIAQGMDAAAALVVAEACLRTDAPSRWLPGMAAEISVWAWFPYAAMCR